MADRAAENEGYRTGPYISGRFLLVPSTARGKGTGHCKRTITLLKTLKDACIYVPERSGAEFRGYDELKDLFSSVDRKKILTSLSGPSDFRVSITDMRKTPSPFFFLLLNSFIS